MAPKKISDKKTSDNKTFLNWMGFGAKNDDTMAKLQQAYSLAKRETRKEILTEWVNGCKTPEILLQRTVASTNISKETSRTGFCTRATVAKLLDLSKDLYGSMDEFKKDLDSAIEGCWKRLGKNPAECVMQEEGRGYWSTLVFYDHIELNEAIVENTSQMDAAQSMQATLTGLDGAPEAEVPITVLEDKLLRVKKKAAEKALGSLMKAIADVTVILMKQPKVETKPIKDFLGLCEKWVKTAYDKMDDFTRVEQFKDMATITGNHMDQLLSLVPLADKRKKRPASSRPPTPKKRSRTDKNPEDEDE